MSLRLQLGFSLLETIMAMTVLTIGGTGVYQYFANVESYRGTLQQKIVFETIADRIDRYIRLPAAIGESGLHDKEDPGNAQLRLCLFGEKKDGCIATDRQIAFFLYMPVTSAKGEILAGTEKSPIYYNSQGERACPIELTNCRFSARAFFRAECPKDQVTKKPLARCTRATGIYVTYSLSHLPPVIGKPAEGLFTDLPQEKEPIFVSGEQIRKVMMIGMECNVGASVEKIESDGTYKCKCIAPFEKSTDPPNERGDMCKLSERANCPENTMERGVSADGFPTCVPINTAITCWDSPPDSSCGRDAWIQRYYASDCVFSCDISKKGGNCDGPVECSGKVKCCKLK